RVEIADDAVTNQPVRVLVDHVAVTTRIGDLDTPMLRIVSTQQTDAIRRDSKFTPERVGMVLLHHQETIDRPEGKFAYSCGRFLGRRCLVMQTRPRSFNQGPLV